jgi:hypothetical protein
MKKWLLAILIESLGNKLQKKLRKLLENNYLLIEIIMILSQAKDITDEALKRTKELKES